MENEKKKLPYTAPTLEVVELGAAVVATSIQQDENETPQMPFFA